MLPSKKELKEASRIPQSKRLIEVQLLGIYGKISGARKLRMEKVPDTIGLLLQELCSMFGPKFEKALIDQELSDPRPNALILINDREINTLEGLNSKLKPGDSVTIIPISHGG